MLNATGPTARTPNPAPLASCPTLDVRYLGLVEYTSALAAQEEIRDRLLRGKGNPALLLLQHPPTITLGSLTGPEDLAMDERLIREHGAAVIRVNRGGRATYHGPGQLVGYPILDLKRLAESSACAEQGPSVRKYLRNLEECLIRVLRQLGLHGERVDGAAGVWVENRKIASVGVAVRRWVTLHGFALNVDLDLSGFKAIHPCGFPAGTMTSVEREGGRVPPWTELEQIVAHEFAAVFNLLPLKTGNKQRVSK